MTRIIHFIENFVYQSKASRLIGIALALSIVKTGVWQMPNLEASWVISRDPFRNPFTDPDFHYQVWTWLSPFLAWLLRIHNLQSFLYFHLLFSVAFTCIFIALVWSRFEERDARTALVLFLAFPVSTTAYFWVGMDSVTLVLMLLLLLAQKRLWLALPLGVLLGMQHFEQGLVALGALIAAGILSFAFKARSPYAMRWAIASLLGVILGKFVLIIIFRHFGIHVNSGRLFMVEQHKDLYLGWFYYYFQYILWSVFGVGWIVVAQYAGQGKLAAPFLLAISGLLPLLALAGDETRVLAIVSFPLVATCLLLNPGFLQSLSGRFVAVVFVLWVVVPYPWAFAGRPLVSTFPYDLVYVLHRLFGWFSVPTNPPLWHL